MTVLQRNARYACLVISAGASRSFTGLLLTSRQERARPYLQTRELVMGTMSEKHLLKPVASWSRFAALTTLIVLLFFVLPLCLHYAGIHSPMLYDSKAFIFDKGHVFHSEQFRGAIGLLPQRPVLMASFYLNYLVDGMDPSSYRLLNIAILALTGLSISLCISAVLKAASPSPPLSDKARWLLSWAGGLLFVVHPMQTYVTLYVWQRAAILGCFWYYAALAVYIWTRLGQIPRNAGYLLVTVLFALAMLTKQNVVTLPAVLILAEALLLSARGKELLRRSVLIAVGSLPAAMLYVASSRLMHHAESLGVKGVSEGVLRNLYASALSPLEVVLSACRMPFHYVAATLAPGIAPVNLVQPMEVSRSLLDPWTTIAACITLVTVVAFSVSFARRLPLLCFGLLLYLVALMPELLLSPHHLYFGHRAILPMLGLFLASIGLVLELRLLLGRHVYWHVVKRGLAGALGLLLIAYSSCTLSLAGHWNAVDLWARAFRSMPSDIRNVEPAPYFEVLKNYSAALAATNDCSAMVKLFKSCNEQRNAEREMPVSTGGEPFCTQKTLAEAAHAVTDNSLLPGEIKSVMLSNLGVVAFEAGLTQAAAETYQEALRLDSQNYLVITNLGNLFFKQEQFEKAIAMQRRAIALDPDAPLAWNNLGAALSASGKLEEAAQAFSQAIQLDSRVDSALANYATVLARLGRTDEAIEKIQSLLTKNADFPQARMWLGQEYQRAGNWARAAEQFSLILARTPEHVPARFHLSQVLMAMSLLDRASTQLRALLQLAPHHAGALHHLGAIRLVQGRPLEAISVLRKAQQLKPDSPKIRETLARALKAYQDGAYP